MEEPTFVGDSHEKISRTMDDRDDDRVQVDVLRAVFCDGSVRGVLDELKEHVPARARIRKQLRRKGSEKNALEMLGDVRERRVELPVQDDRHRSFWPSPLIQQIRALLHHLGSVQPRVDDPDSLLLLVQLALAFPLPFAELLRQGDVLLRDDASRDARAKHAGHEGVEALSREDDGR